MSDTRTLHDRLLQFQKSVEAVKKDSKNPHFKSKYADINTILEEIKPKLNDAGLVLTQRLDIAANQRSVLITVISDGIDSIVSEALLPDLTDPQKFGAAITYYRRYSLQSLLALEAEDDDGNTASSRAPAQAFQSTAPAPTQPSGFKKSVFKPTEV
jgi:hypothetical protein